MEQGPTCSTCHVQCRGETLLLGVPRLVIKYSASLSNTKSLYTLCTPPLVTAGEASACWGRKSELAGRAGKKKRQERVGQRTQKKQSNESKRKLMQLLVPASRVFPSPSGSYRGAEQLIPSALLPNRWCCKPAPLPQAGTQAGARPVPTTCPGLYHTGISSWKDPGRPELRSCSAHQSPSVFRAPFQFFLQFDDINKTKRAGTCCILEHLKTQW